MSKQPNLTPKAIVFDMDGVLVDSTAIHAEAFRRTLATRGLPFAGYDAIAGLRTDTAFRQLMSDADDEAIRACVDEKRALFRMLTGDMAPLMPGCVQTIRALAASTPLGLATSGSRASMSAFLETSGLADAFISTLCGEDVAKAKPAPDLYLRSFEALGVSPREGLVVEDAAAGFAAATSAGAPCVLFRPSADARTRCGQVACAIIHDLHDLTELIAPVRENHP